MTSSGVREGNDGRARCAWVGTDELYARYHDDEWGVELRGDQPLFEKLTLEAFQSGLSWITILRRREGFRHAFDAFDWRRIAAYTDDDVVRLMSDEGIIRNRAKIEATIANARVLTEWLDDEPGGLDALIWSHRPAVMHPAEHRPSVMHPAEHRTAEHRPRPTTLADVPSQTDESRALARDLKARGWRFVGATTAYALMQSAGLVDDHVVGCWRAD